MTTVVTDSSDLDVADPPPMAVVESSAEPAQAPPSGAIAQNLDPRTLVITGNNVRPAPDLADHPKEVASIRRFGVRNPILAVREPDGSVHVIDGQVRTLAAIATGQETVPVWVSEVDPSIGDRERQIERILTQINLNDRRIELTDSARAAGVALMLDLGAGVTRIAEGLQASDRSRIRKAGAIGRSDTARRLLDDGQLSLDQLETLAGYETLGDTDAVDTLTSVTRYQFDYQARLIAEDRQTRRDRLRAALPYAAFGFGVLTDLPDIGTDLIPDSELLTGDGLPVSETEIYCRREAVAGVPRLGRRRRTPRRDHRRARRSRHRRLGDSRNGPRRRTRTRDAERARAHRSRRVDARLLSACGSLGREWTSPRRPCLRRYRSTGRR
ncbi:ParB/RepB/Spo0J family partition protein [Nocardia rhizosphaerihabitans]|uniref:ParB-like N-terminal domain-containing protein n=1 Tax=Nocardia rhizosphaerihabitans TaxID=1691570 RepID=A0ABQ2KBU7_9NOCA|nr:ParB N-terminal domain-containing protein [Nocardia rhizosphaerihabitans]GGN78367.1 hypothetical protein GCM10011610_25800 [Nocardia rhizosphaerihabitans]